MRWSVTPPLIVMMVMNLFCSLLLAWVNSRVCVCVCVCVYVCVLVCVCFCVCTGVAEWLAE